MRAIDITTTPRSFGTTKGQYPDRIEGTMIYTTEGEFAHAWLSDFVDVLGPIASWETHGHTSQGGRLIAVDEDQLFALQQIDGLRRKAKEDRAASPEALAAIDEIDGDINKLLSKHGNEAATEGY